MSPSGQSARRIERLASIKDASAAFRDRERQTRQDGVTTHRFER
jgi:hypothetical protein